MATASRLSAVMAATAPASPGAARPSAASARASAASASSMARSRAVSANTERIASVASSVPVSPESNAENVIVASHAVRGDVSPIRPRPQAPARGPPIPRAAKKIALAPPPRHETARRKDSSPCASPSIASTTSP
jgi:hypothetical protein